MNMPLYAAKCNMIAKKYQPKSYKIPLLVFFKNRILNIRKFLRNFDRNCQPKGNITLQPKIKEWGTVLLRAATILCVLYILCWPIQLSGSSMEPTYRNQDIICINRLSAIFQSYQHGDIVIFDYFDKDGKHTALKRIIGTSGDHIEIGADGVKRNGILLEEDYTMTKTTGAVDIIVPEDTVFVLGDHREISFDSRHMGVISQKDLKAKVLFRLFPFT